MYQYIRLHVDAPPKPAFGQPCNGCGACCASGPCPLGIVVSRRLKGACAALVWAADAGLYRCGLIERPAALLPVGLRWSAPLIAPLLARLARRYISAGSGCDASFALESNPETSV